MFPSPVVPSRPPPPALFWTTCCPSGHEKWRKTDDAIRVGGAISCKLEDTPKATQVGLAPYSMVKQIANTEGMSSKRVSAARANKWFLCDCRGCSAVPLPKRMFCLPHCAAINSQQNSKQSATKARACLLFFTG